MTDKLTHIHDRIYCCRSGSAADTQAVADIVHQHSQLYTSIYNEPPPVHTVAALFEKLCYENKDQLSAGIIVAGWDKENGGSVFNVPLGGGIFQQPWAIGGEQSCDHVPRIDVELSCSKSHRIWIYLCLRLLRRHIP